jgi:hypothetical protein
MGGGGRGGARASGDVSELSGGGCEERPCCFALLPL